MGTELEPKRLVGSLPAPASDPYFYGWRMVPRWDDRGGQTWEKVPLTPWDVLHPEEEDFIVTNDDHARDILYLRSVFEDRLRDRTGMLVLTDHRVEWGDPVLGAHGPDVIVFENLNKEWNARRGTFPVAEMGARPVVAIEITSPGTRYIDLDEKVEDYHKAGIPLYIIADRRESTDGRAFVRLVGYRHTPEGFVRILDDMKGVWVAALGVWIKTEGDDLFCTDDNGTRILPLDEQRDAAEQRVKELEAELKRLRGETN